MALKVGVDLVEVSKVRGIFERNRSLEEAVFTAAELSYSYGRRDPYVHFAARFAAKEAFFKALETGLSEKMDWRDVEICEGNTGRSVLRLSGMTAQVAEEKGVVAYAVSLTHTGRLAAALILLGIKNSKHISD